MGCGERGYLKSLLKSGSNARVFEADGILGDDVPGRQWNLPKEREEGMMKEKWHQISAAISLLLAYLLGARLSTTG